MRFALFYHSLLSDWNHGNAHFLRGVAEALRLRGHQVRVHEPENGWSLSHLRKERRGKEALKLFAQSYPDLHSETYAPDADLAPLLDGVEVAIVHEWTDPAFMARLVEYRKTHRQLTLLFHDTHHRAVTDPAAIERLPLEGFDGVLAFGEILREVYRRRSWHDRVFVWHEAADSRVFRPLDPPEKDGDLIWVGNWGDEERTDELQSYLLQPIQQLGIRARIHGVRYPMHALKRLKQAGVEFAGWLPNVMVPEAFSRYRITAHVPRRAYVRDLPGIPTIRVFEALACGIPLVSAPWDDCEGLFRPGQDFLLARTPEEMRDHMRRLLNEPAEARAVRDSGLARILERHTCEHRADELLGIVSELTRKEVSV